MATEQLTYSRRDTSVDINKRRHLATEDISDMQQESQDAQFVFDALYDDFVESRQKWSDLPPAFNFKIKLPSIVSPLRKYSERGIIIFFPGRMPSAQDVAQWIQSIVGGSFVDGVHFAARGFYDVLLADAKYKQLMLEASPLMFGLQLVHVLPWSPTKDYQSLIKHRCPVWVEVVDFPEYLREQLPEIAAALGKVVCPPRPSGNKNRFCILWDTDKDRPSALAIEVEDVKGMGARYFKLKRGVFAGACFACHKFGHMASECPTILHPPPPAGGCNAYYG